MQNYPSSAMNPQEEPQDPSFSSSHMTSEASGELLESKIANRAQEIAQREGGRAAQSLASWLQAAREILSDNPQRIF